MKREEWKKKLAQDEFLPAFIQLYGADKEVLRTQKERYHKAIECFCGSNGY